MATKSKPIMVWTVEACGGRSRWLIPFTLRRRRTEALKAWLSLWEHGPELRWEYWHRRGYRLVRCTVTAEVS